MPPVVPRPDFMENKPILPDLILEKKEEGNYFTIIPAIGFDVDTGFNFGSFMELYDNGSQTDPFFRSTPYRRKIFLGAVGGTNGYGRGRFGLDAPYAWQSPWRIRTDVDFVHLANANYFGIGSDSIGTLTFPGSDAEFRNYNDFKTALKQDRGGTTYTQYDRYQETSLRVNMSGELDLVGGIVRPLVGLQFAHYWVSDYTGKDVPAIGANGDSVTATQLTTKLATDCQSGRAIGCDGGFDNFLKLGLSLDTRDFEPDPDHGILIQTVGQFATKALGSSFEYVRFTPSLSAYRSLIPSLTRLIIAGRALYSMSWGNVPFYALDTYAFNVEDRFGLGGFQTMRGFRTNRFIGRAGALTNLELRWTITDAEILGQHLRFTLVPFFDAGRTFDNVVDFTLDGWRFNAGGGLKLAWNLSTIISFDYGMSGEMQVFYMELGHVF
jgi:outer membrane protein assembly factor BamA